MGEGENVGEGKVTEQKGIGFFNGFFVFCLIHFNYFMVDIVFTYFYCVMC